MSTEQLITDHLDLWTSAVTYKSGRGAGQGRELTGIKKLRELILELAVRGKLVEQGPNDEPASALLEKIDEERERLINEGEIKKPKKLPVIADDEQPFQLPSGWVWARLGSITTKIGSGATPRGGKNAYTETGIPFLRSQNILNTGISLNPVAYIPMETHKSMGNTHVAPNDVLLNITGASLGRCAIVPETIPEANVSQHVTIIRTTKSSNRRYLHSAILSPFIQSLVWGRQVGMAREGLSKKVLELFEIPIPPEDEQHRIVAKVDELMALCDRLEEKTGDQLDAHEVLVDTLLDALTRAENADEVAAQWARLAEHFDTLFTTEASIDKLKQAILQLAVMGRLVEQDPNDEPASVSLEKIAEEKARLVEEGQLKRSKNLPPISDSEKPYALPKSWQWTYFQSTGYTRLGKMLDNAKNSGKEKKYLRNTNVQWWSFNLSDIKKLLLEEHELAEFSVKDGDLLICEGGEPGRCAVWQNVEREIYIQKAIHRHRTLKGVNPHFLKICLTVSASNGQLSKLFTGATIKHLPGDKLAKYICPFPPVSEQHRIVSKVDELMALCDQLKTCLSDAGDTRTHLAETVVTQAVE